VRIAFDIALGAWVLSEWSVRVRSLMHRQGTRLDRNSMLVVVASAVAGVGGAIAVAKAAHDAAIPDPRWLVFVAGLVLMGAGIAFRQWAVAVLGRFFTVDVRVHEGQTVVERGPYRWLRHPSYTGLIVTFLGLGLALENWAALAVLAVLPTAGLVYCIHFEERALLEGLGEPYRRFAAGRPRLFPGCGDYALDRGTCVRVEHTFP
jgi:protein-S-isoprenylcysteine O-methyltransferase Ste14